MSGAFRPVPRTGVIFVTSEAERRGYRATDPSWCNLGQGQPETGALPGAPPRLPALAIPDDAYEYAPVAGLWELRAAVADAYNRRFRRGLPSQYSAENVAICGGGRLALARAATALGEVNLGHFLPDYTAYEELLSVFRLFTPIPILLEAERRYHFSVDELRKEILGRGLSALLLSNPCNPTGRTMLGSELAAWVATCRSLDCALLIDEFYSHYVWAQADGVIKPIVSAAEYVDDVERDPVVIFDGLTKNWRYPGLRISWTLGPKQVIEAVSSAGSFLDGGGSRPAQLAAVGLLSDEVIDAETGAIRRAFVKKRDFLVSALQELGVRIDAVPQGGFYVWGAVDGLGPGCETGMELFKRALERKVITVPGAFFDINPGHRRTGRASRFERHVRFSFGPRLDVLEEAVRRLRRMVKGEPEPA
ncbi:MAG: pyridoxal phosphate-dependent aminotransferase [Deltaproteobacteria bacterium]|nr:pyridoxal phosphate-dependent aminotransferase [Deltaproteobacteria bacterium]